MYHNVLTAALASHFDVLTLQRLAKETGFVVSDLSLDMVTPFWTLVLGH